MINPLRDTKPRPSDSMRGVRRSLLGAGRECEGESGAGIEQEGAIFLPMGKESDSGVNGEELWGKYEASSSPCGRWSPILEAEWEGGGSSGGEGGGASPERQSLSELL